MSPTNPISSIESQVSQPISKVVHKLYETDARKYAAPHRWQINRMAKFIRGQWRKRAYTRWFDQAFNDVSIFGLEHLEDLDGPCVFIANHQSHLDTILINESLPAHIRKSLFFGAAADRWFVKGRRKDGKRKLALEPWYQSLALGNFPIRRGGGSEALSYAHWLIKKGQHVLLFPEGTRAIDGELGAFKAGATLLALENSVPIIPIHLSGLEKVQAKGQRHVQQGTARVDFLAPIRFSYGSDVVQATACIRRRLARVHEELQNGDTAEAVNPKTSPNQTPTKGGDDISIPHAA
ncbi:MAG: 1-acyl-sn-glycerol-3-phosphate acyltransferase [Limisphaerales bacterium]|jgi:1-acyl-sn-glycerol-3-phosphate acyltransferase